MTWFGLWSHGQLNSVLQSSRRRNWSYKKTCFWPNLKAGNWRATAALTASAMTVMCVGKGCWSLIFGMLRIEKFVAQRLIGLGVCQAV